MKITVIHKYAGPFEVEFSDEDADLALYRWHLAGGTEKVGLYAAHNNSILVPEAPKNKRVYLHRIVAYRMGLIDVVFAGGAARSCGYSVDHIDGNKLNNRRDNLRLLTPVEQKFNDNDGLPVNNTTGYRNVYWVGTPERPRYRVSLILNREKINLGRYDTVEEAAKVRAAFLSEKLSMARG